MANSTQTVVSDGSLALLDISFDYLSRSEITVYFDSVLTVDWAWVGASDKQITFDPVVPNGVTVLVKRTTSIAALLHEFSLGAAFTATSLDQDLKQVLHIAQEASEANLSGEFFADIDMHNFRVRNIGTAIDGTDALSLAQYQADALGAYQSKLDAAASAAAAAQSANDAVTQVNGVLRTGDTMTGALTLAGNAVNALHAVPKQQLDTSLATKQPLDADLTAIAALTTTAYGRVLLTLADAPALRTAVGAATTTTQGVVEKSTQAENEAGTSDTVFPSVLGVAQEVAALQAAGRYDSETTAGLQTITTAGALTLAHGLSSAPFIVQPVLKCTTAEHGYSIGDYLFIDTTGADNGATGSVPTGVAIVPDATDINVRFANFTNVFRALHKTSGAQVSLTNTSWALIVRAMV